MKPRLKPITRVEAFAQGFDGLYLNLTYDYRLARMIMTDFPRCNQVNISDSRWNTRQTRYTIPDSGQMTYVKGSRRWYYHPDVIME
jgi:hypothetical protein